MPEEHEEAGEAEEEPELYRAEEETIPRLPVEHKIRYAKIQDIIGKEVYSENSNRIGKVIDAYIKNNAIYGWLIKVNWGIRKKIKTKKILIRHKYLVSIGNIVIINKEVYEYLENPENFVEKENLENKEDKEE